VWLMTGMMTGTDVGRRRGRLSEDEEDEEIGQQDDKGQIATL